MDGWMDGGDKNDILTWGIGFFPLGYKWCFICVRYVFLCHLKCLLR